jgi:hypothetical protein
MNSGRLIGTGGSAGREGPIAQIGAGFGSFLADRLGLSERERRLLVLSGGAGGIGAVFRAPLGGALFVSEVLYRSTALEFAAVIPAFIASITAYTVFVAIFGDGLAFVAPPQLTAYRVICRNLVHQTGLQSMARGASRFDQTCGGPQRRTKEPPRGERSCVQPEQYRHRLANQRRAPQRDATE